MLTLSISSRGSFNSESSSISPGPISRFPSLAQYPQRCQTTALKVCRTQSASEALYPHHGLCGQLRMFAQTFHTADEGSVYPAMSTLNFPLAATNFVRGSKGFINASYK